MRSVQSEASAFELHEDAFLSDAGCEPARPSARCASTVNVRSDSRVEGREEIVPSRVEWRPLDGRSSGSAADIL